MPLPSRFHQDVQRLINFFSKNNISLYTLYDVLNSNNPNDKFFKVYINYPYSKVVAHKPICPGEPDLIVGYGNATDNGFWVGLFLKDEGDPNSIINQIATLLNLRNPSLCARCKVK